MLLLFIYLRSTWFLHGIEFLCYAFENEAYKLSYKTKSKPTRDIQ